jgi:hypothetical protein
MKNSISKRTMESMCPIPPKQYTREELQREMEGIIDFLGVFVTGKSYYGDKDEKLESLLAVAYTWACQVLELRYKAKENWDFAMRLVDCHIKDRIGFYHG